MNINRKLVLDTETTGLKVENGDRVIEIGIVELVDNIKTGNNYQVYLNPEKKIERNAQKIHGLSNEFLRNKPKFYEIANELKDYISDSTLIIHNAEFDMKFLEFELENCGHKKLSNDVIDTIDIARKEFPGQSVSLDSLCRKLKVDKSARIKHGALMDADLLCSVYLEMTTGKQSYLEFDKIESLNEEFKISIKDPDNDYSKKYDFNRKKKNVLPEEEYEKHKKFIKTIKNSLWEEFNKN